MSLFDLSVGFWRFHLQGSLYLTWLEAAQCEKPHWKQLEAFDYFHGCLRQWIAVGATNRLNKKLKRQHWGNESSLWLWKPLTYSWESRRPNTYIGLCACLGLGSFLGRIWEGPKLLSQADVEILHKQKAKARPRCQLPGWVLKACPNICADPLSEDGWMYLSQMLKEVTVKPLAHSSTKQAGTSVATHNKKFRTSQNQFRKVTKTKEQTTIYSSNNKSWGEGENDFNILLCSAISIFRWHDLVCWNPKEFTKEVLELS